MSARLVEEMGLILCRLARKKLSYVVNVVDMGTMMNGSVWNGKVPQSDVKLWIRTMRHKDLQQFRTMVPMSPELTKGSLAQGET